MVSQTAAAEVPPQEPVIPSVSAPFSAPYGVVPRACYGGVWIRILAYIIDGLVFIIPALILQACSSERHPCSSARSNGSTSL